MPEPSGLSRVPEGGLRRLSIPSAFCRSSSTICQSVLPWHCWRCSIRRDGRVVDCTGLENHLSSSLRVTYLGIDASQDALLSIKTKLYLSIFCQQPRAEITDSSYATVVPDGSMVRRAPLLRYSFRRDSFAAIIHPACLYGGPSMAQHFHPG